MKTLGVFDSGIGGFNVVAHLRAHRDLDIVFLADHKNLPYGTKEASELKEILKTNLQWFKDKGINHVLIACNTASNFIDYLREEFPEMTIDSIIEITASQFNSEDLVIFGTDVTTREKKYDQYLQKHERYHALSELAGLVEFGDDHLTKEYLKRELKLYKKEENKYLLACTHYSIVEEYFKKYLKGEIYDSIGPILNYYENFKGNRSLEVYSSGNVKVLKDQLLNLFNYDVEVKPYRDDFQIVVVSDNHGLYAPLSEVLFERHKDASLFIHCGDTISYFPLLENFYIVNGNGDYTRPFDDHLTVTIRDLTIYITHSHEHMTMHRMEDLYEDAKRVGASLVCYGHEHVRRITEIEDVILLNPGSLNYNRDNTPPSYALIKVDKDNKMEIEFLEV